MPTPNASRPDRHSWLTLTISAAVFAASVVPSSVSAGPGPTAAKAKLVKAGAELFKKNCLLCHGENAKGTKMAPKLQGITLSDAALTKKITNGKAGQMPAFGGKLKPDDFKALIAYLRSLKK